MLTQIPNINIFASVINVMNINVTGNYQVVFIISQIFIKNIFYFEPIKSTLHHFVAINQQNLSQNWKNQMKS